MNKHVLGIFVLMVSFLLGGCGVKYSTRHNYEHTLSDIKSSDLHWYYSYAVEHLQQINTDMLEKPRIYLVSWTSARPSFRKKLGRSGRVWIYWSQEEYMDYDLRILYNGKTLATIKPAGTSGEDPGAESFNYIIHHAFYIVENKLYNRIQSIRDQGGEVDLQLVNSSLNLKSNKVRWKSLKRPHNED